MIALIRTELLRLTSIRATWGLLTAAVALTLTRVAMVLASIGSAAGAAPASRELWYLLLGAPGLGTVCVLMAGVLAVSTEHKQQTWTPTLLVTPDRTRVLLAKTVTLMLAGATVALVLTLMALAAGMAFGPVKPFVDLHTVRLLTAVMVAAAFWGWIGVALGALIANQTAAMALPLFWLLIVETLVPSYGLAWLSPWLPGGAISVIGRAGMYGGPPFWAAFAVITAYAVALGAGGRVRIIRADIA